MADVKVPLDDVEAGRVTQPPLVVVVERRRAITPLLLVVTGLLLFSAWNMMPPDYPSPAPALDTHAVDVQGCRAPFSAPTTNGMFREHRDKLLARFRSSSQTQDDEWVLLLGNAQEERSNSDTDILFRQDSNFLYLTGYNVPDVSFLLSLETMRAVMLVRRKSRSEIIFDGGVDDFDTIKAETDSDDVLYDDEILSFLGEQTVSRINVVSSTDALARFPELASYTFDSSRLLAYLFGVRQVKTERELQLLRISSDVTSRAHEAIMQAVRPSDWTESDLESLFLHECYNCGLRFQSYIGIFGAGKNGAVLHYVQNDAPVGANDMILVDAAGEYRGYTSDVTRTFPANGLFTSAQTAIYNTVLQAQKAAIEACAPGVSWSTITSIANRKLVEGLAAAGVLVGSIDELLSAGVLSTFYPHGLGHPVGLDVHDPTPSPWVLAYNQVFTIEPGVYFVEMLIEEARANTRTAKYYNFDVIDRYINFGGVRIEDCIRITEDSYEVITDAPKEISDVEQWMAGARAVADPAFSVGKVAVVKDPAIAVGKVAAAAA